MMSLAWLFPGQGTQFVGMGKALHAASPAAREVFERADAALGWSIARLCFEGPESDLTLTKHTQPAIVTTSIAALAALRERHPELPPPTFAAGHSLGEYSALVAAEALSLEDAVRLVHLRGRAMQEAVPEGRGAMAAIMGGDAETVRQLCVEAAQGDVVSPANFNAPGQVVIAGHAEAVARASELANRNKLRVIPLKVSAPFHCSLMAPATEVITRALRDIHFRQPVFPVISNVEATPNRDPARIPELLARQIESPVRWDQTIQVMAENGVIRALELGPGKVLSGLVKRIDKRIALFAAGEPESVVRAGEFLAAAAPAPSADS